MIPQNNHLSPLPWVKTLDEQAHRQTYAYGRIHPLYTEANFMLPFQIIYEGAAPLDVSEVLLYRSDDTLVGDITSRLFTTGLYVSDFTDYSVIIYPGLLPVSVRFDDGQYYMKMTTSAGVAFSEVFTVVQSVAGYVKVEWWDDRDFLFDGGRVVYDGQYRNRVYLATEIGMPEYTFDEEGEERDGVFFPVKQLSEKTYRFTFLSPEYLCDVLRLVRMADHCVVTDKHGRQYMCNTFLMTPKWQPQGYLAAVDVEFQTNTVMKKTGWVWYPEERGDFNNDFNNDFNITDNNEE